MLSDIEADGTQDDIIFPSALPFLSVHLACFAAIWSGVTWQSVVLCASLYWLRIFAIGAGYHRYFSHHAYSRPAREPHVSAPCPPGDYIFVHAGPAEAGGGGGSPPHLDYRVDIPKTLPAALLHVGSGQRRAVVELDTVTNLKGVGPAAVGRLRHRRTQIADEVGRR